ncbi:hypothetical protein PUN28_011284 [Cardiocondyla obscurior]|uniref:Uncharacterized protein n=1 Tax=Cardiocondyla obscurior TaxID=286306 RepID=A0AAW2FD14_9HYME
MLDTTVIYILRERRHRRNLVLIFANCENNSSNISRQYTRDICASSYLQEKYFFSAYHFARSYESCNNNYVRIYIEFTSEKHKSLSVLGTHNVT